MLKYKNILLGVAVLLPFVLVTVLTIVVTVETETHGDKRDPNFQYGETQVQSVSAIGLKKNILKVQIICLFFYPRLELIKVWLFSLGSSTHREFYSIASDCCCMALLFII